MVTKGYYIGEIAERFFSDKCDVKRAIFQTDEHGIDQLEYECVYEDVKCRVSYIRDSINEETRTASKINHNIRILLPFYCKTKIGDIFVIKKGDCEDYYKSSTKSRIYMSHREVDVEIMEKNP